MLHTGQVVPQAEEPPHISKPAALFQAQRVPGPRVHHAQAGGQHMLPLLPHGQRGAAAGVGGIVLMGVEFVAVAVPIPPENLRADDAPRQAAGAEHAPRPAGGHAGAVERQADAVVPIMHNGQPVRTPAQQRAGAVVAVQHHQPPIHIPHRDGRYLLRGKATLQRVQPALIDQELAGLERIGVCPLGGVRAIQ